jgi:tripartite-type tricarboxylate transporter receptor subunit TctC
MALVRPFDPEHNPPPGKNAGWFGASAKGSIMKKMIFAAALAAASHLATPAIAQDYPTHPIKMVAPLGVGGSTDVIGRIMAQGMGTVLGQSIVVENTTGAGGTIGEGRIAHSDPDGYTIGIGQWGTNVATGAIYNLNYDLLKDFEPIGLIATQPFFVVARKTMPANNLKELIAWLREKGDKATMGHSGVGSPSHVAGILFQNDIGTKLTMVPYRGAGEATQAILSGQIDVLLATPAVSVEQMRAGNLKAYALTASNRIVTAPDVPTTAEAGLPDFQFSFWHALWAPKGTPKPIIARLNDALVKSLADPATRKKLTDLAQDIFPRDQQTPEALYAYQKSEIEKWWPIIKAAGIKPQ